VAQQQEEQLQNSTASTEQTSLNHDQAFDRSETNTSKSNISTPIVTSGEYSFVSSETSSLANSDDVFLPTIRKVSGVEEYHVLKETLSWTGATTLWPEVEKTDWVALDGDAILSAGSPTVAVVRGTHSSLKILGGEHLIFLNNNDVSIEQYGGMSQIYYDTSVSGNIKIDVSGGATVLTNVSLDVVEIQENMRHDGATDFVTGQVSIEYKNSVDGDVYLNDLVSGKVSKLPPNYQSRATSVVEENVVKIEEIDFPITLEMEAQVSQEVKKPLKTEEPKTFIDDRAPPGLGQFISENEIDLVDLFEGDVLLRDDMTDIVREYLLVNTEPVSAWANSNQFMVNIIDTSEPRVGVDEARAFDEDYSDFSENLSTRIDDILAIDVWTDLLPQDLMDFFDAE
jgi:hypothetical protein